MGTLKSYCRRGFAGFTLKPLRIIAVFLPAMLCGLASALAQTGRYTALGYNELGMHCMNQDFSEICILPPFNTLRVQVIDRAGEHPRIVQNGVVIQYSIPGNTTSFPKTNFWRYSKPLFGANLPLDRGLTGNGLNGRMMPSGNNDWVATGIPVTPLTDKLQNNPFQLARIVVKDATGTTALTDTKAVIPVSWEISCNLCHNNPNSSVATDILRRHDRLHGTKLMAARPVLCAGCHADPALGTSGKPGISSFSHAMHSSHAPRMNKLGLTNSCYACHPGVKTECQRDVHISLGIDCVDCHGNMAAVGNVNRTPWVDEPTCAQCHSITRPNFAYEEPGKLFKDSKGHGNIHCAACHGPQHAVGPAVTAADNVQAILKQGHPGVISDCRVCHSRPPGDPFFHNRGDD